MGVMITNLNLRKTRKGKTFASFNAEDLSDGIECVCWDYDQNASILKDNAALLIEAEFSHEPRTQLVVRTAIPIQESVPAHTEQTLVILKEENLTPEKESDFKSLCNEAASNVNSFEQRKLSSQALKMVHKNQQELIPKFEKYLQDTFRVYAKRSDLEKILMSDNFATFNQNVLLQPDQKKKLLHFFKEMRSHHRLYILVLTKDGKEVWLEPHKSKNFLPTWDFICSMHEIFESGSVKIKSAPFVGEVRRQYKPTATT